MPALRNTSIPYRRGLYCVVHMGGLRPQFRGWASRRARCSVARALSQDAVCQEPQQHNMITMMGHQRIMHDCNIAVASAPGMPSRAPVQSARRVAGASVVAGRSAKLLCCVSYVLVGVAYAYVLVPGVCRVAPIPGMS
eukprot:1009456-Pyramimonas_sp.AAC.1